MGRKKELVADGIYRKRVSDTALSADPGIDSIWIEIVIKEVKAARAPPTYVD